MPASIALVAALSLDSFVVCLALGPLAADARSRLRLAAMFGLWDALAVVIGAAIGTTALRGYAASWNGLAPVVVFLYGIYVLMLARAAARRTSRVVIFGLPAALGLDNALAGLDLASTASSVVTASAAAGLASGLLAFAGLRIGAALAQAAPMRSTRPALLAGPGLLCAALVLLVAS